VAPGNDSLTPEARPAAEIVGQERGDLMIEGSYQGFSVVIEPPGIAVFTLGRPERLNAMSGSSC
jgi:hypothetical protein